MAATWGAFSCAHFKVGIEAPCLEACHSCLHGLADLSTVDVLVFILPNEGCVDFICRVLLASLATHT